MIKKKFLCVSASLRENFKQMNIGLIRRFVFFLIINVIFFLPGNVVAQDDFIPVDDPQPVLDKIIAANENIFTIQSDFTQTKHLSFLDEDVISEGRFYFRKINQLRWEYSDPFYYLIIFNDDKIYIKTDETKPFSTTSSNIMTSQINELMVGIVDGSVLKSDQFTITYFQSPDQYLLILFPRDSGMRDFLHEIHLYISKQDKTVAELRMIEASEDFTLIRFSNKVLNEEIPDKVFLVE